MCKTLAKAQHFAIINVQNDFSYFDIFNALADRHKFHKKENPAFLECIINRLPCFISVTFLG